MSSLRFYGFGPENLKAKYISLIQGFCQKCRLSDLKHEKMLNFIYNKRNTNQNSQSTILTYQIGKCTTLSSGNTKGGIETLICFGLVPVKKFLAIPNKITVHLPFDPETLLLIICPREIHGHIISDICRWSFIVTLFVIAKHWK